jgi:hypothetical protein
MAKRRKKSWKGQILSVFGLLTAIVFMPTTIILMVGMLPTIVTAFFDTAKKKTHAMTIGFINVAGCTPFILHLWFKGHEVENAVEIITNPLSMIVMWSSAGVGLIIDKALSGIVGTVMIERGKSRQNDIKKAQGELTERWGEEVTGEIPLDSYGFPVHAKSLVKDESAERDDGNVKYAKK